MHSKAVRILLLLGLGLVFLAPAGCQRKTTRKVEYEGPGREVEVKVERKDKGDRYEREHGRDRHVGDYDDDD